jgi:cell division septum initiation protein DivIVA
MARGRTAEDLTTIQMALVGYQIEKQRIEEKIRDLEARLKGKQRATPSGAADANQQRPKRVLSAAARRRIAAAQKKRWAEHRKRMAQGKNG